MAPPPFLRALAAPVALLLLALAACASPEAEPGGEPAPRGADAPQGTGIDGVTVTGAPGSEPTVKVEQGLSVDQTTVEVLDPGSGPRVEPRDTVTVDYVGVNASTGKTFDSSWQRGRPAQFPLGPQMIRGFNQALTGQRVGSRIVAALPPSAAYGETGNPRAGIGGDDTLVFVVEVQDIMATQAKGEAVPPPPGLPALELDAQQRPVRFSADRDTAPAPDQLKVHTVIQGDGPVVQKGDTITVHYLGQIYPDGDIFDESWRRQQPATFQVGTGNLIEGWDEGLVGQKVGSRVILVVPPDQGYGKTGQPAAGIGGDDTLIFAVDILDAS